MALPILETPTYELNLPSTNKKVKYRPFLVKEYKILLTNIEASANEISRVISELVDNCTFNKLDVEKLPNFDLEYLFLNIRAKSISETADVVVTCNCGNKIDHTIDITNLQVVKKSNIEPKIMLTDDVGVILRYPRFDEMLEIYDNLDSVKILELVSNCIDAVFTKEDYYESNSYSKEDLNTFVKVLVSIV